MFRRVIAEVIVLAVLGLLILAASPAAYSETFSVSGAFAGVLGSDTATFEPGSTITIDTTTGLATDADLKLELSGSLFNGFVVSVTGPPNGTSTTTEYDWFQSPTVLCPSIPFAICILSLQETNGTGFEGFTGGDLSGGWFYICHCISGTQVTNFVNEVALTPVPAVPEPSSVILLSSVLGVIGATLRRKRRRAPH